MSCPPPSPDGWFGPKDHRPAELRLVPGPVTTPCDPKLFPFWLAVVIATAVLAAGAIGARYWLIPILLVQEEGFKAPPVQIATADLLEAEKTVPVVRVARLKSVQPPSPRVNRPPPMPAVQAETLVQAEWERPAEEPYDPTEILEEADLPFPIAKDEPPVTKAPPRSSKPRTSRQSESRPKESPEALPRGESSPARVVRRRNPTYPRSARRDGVEGRVVLSVQVRSDGRVGSVRVASSSGSAVLDSAAISAVKSWSFAPEMQNGQHVSATVNVPFKFALQ